MSLSFWRNVTVLMVGLGAISSPLAAQSFTVPVAPNFAFSNLQRELLDLRNSGVSQQDTRELVARAQVVSSTFVNSPARTQQNLQSFIARTNDVQAKADLRQLVSAKPNVMDEIASGIRAYGLDPYDVADAYAVWWMSTWLAANQRNDTPSASTVEAVRQQVRAAMADLDGFAQTSDAERQEYAEALLLQTTIMDGAIEEAKADSEMLAKLAGAARKAAKEHGLDLSLMTLTANGFVPRAGADASETIGDDHAHALAEDSSLEQYSDGDSSMGIALAAGAGLGLVLLAGGAILRKG